MRPKKLKKGDIIGIVSPSDPVPSENDEGFNKGLEALEKKGFSIVVGAGVFSKNPEERAKDINEFFLIKKFLHKR